MKPTRFTEQMIEQYFENGYWPKESSVDLFDRYGQRYPDAIALKDSRGNQVTWSELKVKSDRLAVHFLKMGFKHDDTAVVHLPNLLENGILRVALQKSGVIAAFPGMTMRDAEMHGIVTNMNAKGLFVSNPEKSPFDFLKMARDLKEKTDLEFIFVVGKEADNLVNISALMEEPVKENDILSLAQTAIRPQEVGMITCTSGTTGLPKLCEWPDAPILLHGRTIVERMKITTDDILGILAPLSGGPGISIWNAGFQVPCTMILQERSDAEADLELVEKEKITVIGVVPAQIIRMLRHPNYEKYDLSSLRAIRPGGAPMSPTVAQEIEEKMPWCKVVVASGTSESMSLCHTHIDDSFEDRLFTVGKPWLYSEIRILNKTGKEIPKGQEGEVAVRGACTGGGYFKDEERTKEVWGTLGEGGWYKTGDIGKIDEKGNLKLLGREKEIIIRGGQNVYPKEVEDFLLQHPKVADVAIVSMPDAVMGEKGCAFVITKRNQELNLDEVKAFLDGKKIAKFKYPERLEVLQKFPLLGTGKVNRKELKERAAKFAEEKVQNLA
jgi:non-ribosomal peptide synthetase component E (peptide arylation enzyme)